MANEVDFAAEEAGFLERMAINTELQRIRGELQQCQGESLEDCVTCDLPIPRARREAQPGCTQCAECKSRDEVRGGRR